MRAKHKKALIAVLATVALLLAIVFVFNAGTRSPNHGAIKIAFSHYNDNSDIVCSVTFSNASDSTFLALVGTPVYYLAESNWVHTFKPDPGATPGPYFPHQVYRTKIVIPENATAVRVGDYSEHIPALLEKIAAIPPRGQLSFGIWWYASKVFKTRIETNWSDQLDLVPFTIAKTNGSPLPNFRSVSKIHGETNR